MNITFDALFKDRTPNLNLAKIQTRYVDDPKFPRLLTIYELMKAVDVAMTSVQQILEELSHPGVGKASVRGLFVLGIANFESMQGDLMRKFLSFYPQKLSILASNESQREGVGTYMLNSGNIVTLDDQIDGRVNKLLYANLMTIGDNYKYRN